MTQPDISAATRLLDREMPEDYLAERTAIISAKTQNDEGCKASAIVFRIGLEWLALPTAAFQEVAKLSGIHTLPHSRSTVLNGLVNVRGELLLCAALDVLLGIERMPVSVAEQRPAVEEHLLVCTYAGDRVAFPVCEVIGIYTYAQRDVRNIPATPTKSPSCMTGVLYWKDKAIGCLGTELLFQALNKEFE